MSHAREMVMTHPQPTQVDKGALVECIQACYECAQSCTACADACLGESHLEMLRRCISRCMDCADVCEVTGRLVSRQTETDWELVRSQLQACATACRLCAGECHRHAGMHEHCRVCAESCERCERACNNLLTAVAA